jgi:enterochelin esterase-like enzyme
MKEIVVLTWSALCLLLLPVVAQPPARVVSPEVLSDGRVTFRFPAPNAQRVAVSIEGQTTPVPMQKDGQGVWSVTVGPLAPDIYGYSFVADEVSLIDPANPLLKPNLLHTESAVHVPGSSSVPWELVDMPHGEIHHHFYHSKIAADEHDFYVYTPPGYDTRGPEYPVLYLLHGFSDDASGWTAVGRAHLVLDHLIADGKAKPMIVVMPLGYGDLEVVRRGWGAWRDPQLAWRNLDKFSDLLLSEIMPQVEQFYRVKPDREWRAIAGLSMGGAESLLTGLNHLDQFAWVGAFSSGGLETRPFAQEFPGLGAGANQKLKLLWIACGTEDALIEPNRRFKSWLKQQGVAYTQVETPGMHTWMVWRRNLAAFAPLLFR